jgi:hypothetical protein
MLNGFWAVAMSAAMQVGAPGPSETPNFPALQNAYEQYGFEGQYEQRYPIDTQQNWVHGYFQEIPAYGGHPFFRPYNYKDILSQSQVSAGWGHSPVLPYSQQFWHKYHDQATMLKLSRMEAWPPAGVPAQTMYLPVNAAYYRPAKPQLQYYPPTNVLPAPSAVPSYSAPALEEPTGPSLEGPTLQPANGQQFVDPAFAPR